MWRPFVFLLLVAGYGLTGCNIINPDEPIPGTIRLQPFDFQTISVQGSNKQRITEVWVYHQGNVLGAFAPPVDIRLPNPTSGVYTFRPGIRNNGIHDDAIIHPILDGYMVELDMAPGKIVEVTPVTRYRNGATFKLLADFETGNEFTVKRDTIMGSALVLSDTEVFEGQYAGHIVMTKEADFIEVTHAVAMPSLPADGKPVYLELWYKNEVPFSIGIIGETLQNESFAQFFYLAAPTQDWNMLYIELTEWIQVSALPAYRIAFRSEYPSNATAAEHHIYFDNIKVVHL